MPDASHVVRRIYGNLGRLLGGKAGATVEVLDAASGQQLWSYAAGGSIYGAPSLAEGMIFAGSADDAVYAFALPSTA